MRDGERFDAEECRMKQNRAKGTTPTSLISCITGVLFLTIVLSGCGESGTDTVLAQKIRIEVIEPTLVAHKICSDVSNCKEQYIAFYSVSDEVAWSIYGITDRQFINDVFSRILVFSKELPRNKRFSIRIYSQKRSAVGFYNKPTVELSFQGEK